LGVGAEGESFYFGEQDLFVVEYSGGGGGEEEKD